MALFDTHAVIKDLIGTGLPEKTAEVVVQAIKNSKDIDINNLASKEQVASLASKEQVTLLERDFEHMKESVASKADLVEVKTELKADIAELKAEIFTAEKRLEEKIHQIRTELAQGHTTMLKWYISSTFIIVSLLFAGFGAMLKLLNVF